MVQSIYLLSTLYIYIGTEHTPCKHIQSICRRTADVGFPVYAKHGGAGGMPVPQPLDKAGMACGRLPLNAPVLGGACHSMIPLASRFLAFSTLRIIPQSRQEQPAGPAAQRTPARSSL